MKKTVLALASALLLAASATAAPPLGILEIRGIDNLAGAVFDLSKTVGQPVPKEMVSLGIYSTLGTMPGMGIQPNGTVRVLWMEDGANPGSVAVLLPVDNDGSDYLASIEQQGWAAEDEMDGGILPYVAPNGSFLPWRKVFFAKNGSTLVAASKAQDAAKAVAAIADLPPILPAEGVVAQQISPAALVDAFGPLLFEAMEDALDASPVQQDDAAELGRIYAQAYLAVAKQLDEVVLGIGLADGNLNLHSRVAPVQGTLLCKWMGSLQSPSTAASVVNLPGALYAETVNLGDVGLLAEPYFAFVEKMMAAMPAEMADALPADYLANAKTWWAQMDGDVGMALLPPTPGNPFRFAEFVALKDSANLRELAAGMVDDARKMIENAMQGEAAEALSVSLEMAEPREYRGVPVDRIAYAFKIDEALAAQIGGKSGMQFDVEIAWLPNAVLVGVGGQDVVDAMIDRSLDGAVLPVASLDSWKRAFPAIDDHPIDYATLSLFDALRSYLAIGSDFLGEDLGADFIPDGPGSLSSLSYMAMGGMMTRVRFALDDVAAVVAKVQEAQQRAMEAVMKQMEEEGNSDGEEDDLYEEVEYQEWDDSEE
jgi:hypothetical protein